MALTLTGAGLLIAAHQVRDTPAAANHALTDTTATEQVTGEISTALAKIFSYTPEGTEATRRSAAEVLGGRAAAQYEELFGQLRERVAAQRLTLSTQVVRAGVERLDGDSAHLLFFLDQTARRGDKAPTRVPAQLSVTAHKEEGQWRIVELKAR
ncbi:hypothetical protein HUT18_07360 [Streptomyces sp. NA04227]|nr:hypothetical protein HUT18_07360 [Streptomyces sp. NA04227]